MIEPQETAAAAAEPAAEPIARRHRWDHDRATYLAGHESPDGNARTFKPCTRCPIVKVTVTPPHGLPWHEWKLPDGKVWQVDGTPPCREWGKAA